MFRCKKNNILPSLLMVFLLVALASGCAPKTEKAATPTPVVTTPVIKTNVTPNEKNPSKPLKIASITVQNNPFWFPVKDGVLYAKQLLASKNTTVDFIAVDDFDAKKFNDTIETCIAKQYDAITVVGVSDAIIPAINKAVDAGIVVNTFNSEPDKASKRTAFFGQDLYNAGVIAGETLIKEIGGEGEVAIITGSYSVPAHELRRKGGMEAIAKNPKVKIVGQVENKDKAETAYAQAKDFLTANPNLKGIYVTAGGPFGAAKAIDELGLTGKVKIVCFDFVDETIQYVRKGIISATIGQDPFGQGFDPVVYAYNQIVTGQKPPKEKMWTKLDVVSKDTVNDIIGPEKK